MDLTPVPPKPPAFDITKVPERQAPTINITKVSDRLDIQPKRSAPAPMVITPKKG